MSCWPSLNWSTALLFHWTVVTACPVPYLRPQSFFLGKPVSPEIRLCGHLTSTHWHCPSATSTMKGSSARGGFSPCRRTCGDQRISVNSMAASHSCCSLRVPMCSFQSDRLFKKTYRYWKKLKISFLGRNWKGGRSRTGLGGSLAVQTLHCCHSTRCWSGNTGTPWKHLPRACIAAFLKENCWKIHCDLSMLECLTHLSGAVVYLPSCQGTAEARRSLGTVGTAGTAHGVCQAVGACPTAPARIRAAGGHQGHPSPRL